MSFARLLAIAALMTGFHHAQAAIRSESENLRYEHPETRDLVTLVNGAAELVRKKGEGAFAELSRPGSRWRKGERYVFVLDPKGMMLVHPDPALQGKNDIDLKDVNGKPIIRGLIETATAFPDKPSGWYHYEWPVPGEILPRWKSSFVRSVEAPSKKRYIVGSGMYDDRMEKDFVVDLVNDAADLIEREGKSAFAAFHDPKDRFIAKDAYIFVFDPSGVDLVNPAFPNLEGRSLLDLKDTQGKEPVREMLKLVQARSFGWVSYLWPKPGDSVSTQKSAYVTKVKLGDSWVLVGCGVYLAHAPQSARPVTTMTASELIRLVNEGAAVLEKRGAAAFPEFRNKGSKWFRDDTYFFVWNMEGTRIFHAADPKLEGLSGADIKDIQGRPYGKMFLQVAQSPSGEGWVHYMYPEPGKIFPAWKSTFLKRVRFPDGKDYLVGCGVYNMKMDPSMIEDVVKRASILVLKKGKDAFPELRDKTGPFFFMDTYVFVDAPDGLELVNPAQPTLEGRNLLDLKDARGRPVAREYIDLALKRGGGWLEYSWYKPGSNEVTRKRTYVRKVQSGRQTYIVGSGFYMR